MSLDQKGVNSAIKAPKPLLALETEGYKVRISSFWSS